MATKHIVIPDIGDFQDVAIIDVYIKVGTILSVEDSVVALESEKAVIEIPSPFAGKITKVLVKEGDLVSKDTPVAEIEVASEDEGEEKDVSDGDETELNAAEKDVKREKDSEAEAEQSKKKEDMQEKAEEQPTPDLVNEQASGSVFHATPLLRKYARELGVELSKVEGYRTPRTHPA